MWVVFACAALCAVFLALLAVAQAVQARHRAGAAADLAALAASDEALLGRAEACATARRVAAAQGARLTRCTLAGEVSDLTVTARAGGFTVEVRARAGPGGDEPRRGTSGRAGR